MRQKTSYFGTFTRFSVYNPLNIYDRDLWRRVHVRVTPFLVRQEQVVWLGLEGGGEEGRGGGVEEDVEKIT